MKLPIEFEYAYCNDAGIATYSDCKQSCEDMNTGGVTGWSLATIPTQMHNNQVSVDFTTHVQYLPYRCPQLISLSRGTIIVGYRTSDR